MITQELMHLIGNNAREDSPEARLLLNINFVESALMSGLISVDSEDYVLYQTYDQKKEALTAMLWN